MMMIWTEEYTWLGVPRLAPGAGCSQKCFRDNPLCRPARASGVFPRCPRFSARAGGDRNPHITHDCSRSNRPRPASWASAAALEAAEPPSSWSQRVLQQPQPNAAAARAEQPQRQAQGALHSGQAAAGRVASRVAHAAYCAPAGSRVLNQAARLS